MFKNKFPLISATLFIFLGTFSIQEAIAFDGRHALIIGIGQYSEVSNTPELKGVEKDMENARRMAYEMGVKDEQITMVRDAQATKQNIIKELKKLAQNTRTGDRVFIYHSGHGTQYQKEGNCLQGLQTYTEGKFTYDDILTDQEIASYTKPISEKADKVIVMIDACFSGGVIAPTTRALSNYIDVKPKFNLNSGQSCINMGVNQLTRTRSLLSEVQRLGIQDENFVQIAAAKDNEFSWDNKELGGLATHTMTQCLMGRARDLNGSGAISLDEIRMCAQAQLNEIMKPYEKAGLLPSTIQVRGNRNLIPVTLVKPPIQNSESKPPESVPAQDNPPQKIITTSELPKQDLLSVSLLKQPAQTLANPINTPTDNKQESKPPISTPPPQITLNPPSQPTNQVDLPPLIPPIKPGQNQEGSIKQEPVTAENVKLFQPIPEMIPPAIASIETLKDIINQSNPKRSVEVKPDKSIMKIGVDALKLEIKSSHDGYLYVVLLGSDAKSFYILYPNGLDSDNKITKLKPVRIPRPSWEIKAAGPAGTDQLLVMITDSPRQLNSLVMASPTASEPFTYALNDLGGRSALIDFLTGSGVKGRSESFGAKLISVKEVGK